jgi:hypothetical protein
MCLQLIRQLLSEDPELGISDPMGGKEVLQAVGIADPTQASAEKQAVISMEYSDDLLLAWHTPSGLGTQDRIWDVVLRKPKSRGAK